ncbi:unnamed protein product [Prunus armeniaca]
MDFIESPDPLILFGTTVAIVVIVAAAYLFTPKNRKDNMNILTGSRQVIISESSAMLKRLLFSSFGVPSGSIIDTYTANPTYPKNFVRLGARPHPECIKNIKKTYQLDKKKEFLSLVEMDESGNDEKSDPAITIVKERMKRFGFKP